MDMVWLKVNKKEIEWKANFNIILFIFIILKKLEKNTETINLILTWFYKKKTTSLLLYTIVLFWILSIFWLFLFTNLFLIFHLAFFPSLTYQP